MVLDPSPPPLPRQQRVRKQSKNAKKECGKNASRRREEENLATLSCPRMWQECGDIFSPKKMARMPYDAGLLSKKIGLYSNRIRPFSNTIDSLLECIPRQRSGRKQGRVIKK